MYSAAKISYITRWYIVTRRIQLMYIHGECVWGEGDGGCDMWWGDGWCYIFLKYVNIRQLRLNLYSIECLQWEIQNAFSLLLTSKVSRFSFLFFLFAKVLTWGMNMMGMWKSKCFSTVDEGSRFPYTHNSPPPHQPPPSSGIINWNFGNAKQLIFDECIVDYFEEFQKPRFQWDVNGFVESLSFECAVSKRHFVNIISSTQRHIEQIALPS